MQQAIFAVGDEPYLLWEEDVSERARDFLSGLDPEYFSYVLKVHATSDDKERAAVGVRLALHHATETMFSLLGALVQAPDCPYAWLAKCSNLELRQVVRRITDGDRTLLSKFKLSGMGWEPIAALIFQPFENGTEKQKLAIQGFSKLWTDLAKEHLTEVVIEEYNATKHGFRTRPGGFRLEFGPANSKGTRQEDMPMKVLGESKFGSMFFKVDKVGDKGTRQLLSRQVALNWSPERDRKLLQLVHLSVHNTLAFLKTAHRFPAEECRYLWPDDEPDFIGPWEHTPGVLSMTFPYKMPPPIVGGASKNELLQALREALGGNV